MKIVQSFWWGRELFDIQVMCINSWLENGYKYILYCYEPPNNVPRGVALRDASNIVPKHEVFFYEKGHSKGSPAAFSNYFRYRLLYSIGGLWSDTDVVCLKPFETEGAIFLTYQDHSSTVAPHYSSKIVATFLMYSGYPHQTFFSSILEEFSKVDISSATHGNLGPDFLTGFVKKTKRDVKIENPYRFNAIPWFAIEQFLIPREIDGGWDTLHLWDSIWRRNNLKFSDSYHYNSIIEQLKKRYLFGC